MECYFCLNARIDDSLTDENDLSDIAVGKSDPGYRISLVSGGGVPLRFDLFKWDCKIRQNILVCYYFPKFCPECGREISEYSHLSD